MIELYTDGRCFPNPGGHLTWAWVATQAPEGQVAQASGYLPPGPDNTNNTAEYRAVLEALRWLARHPAELTRQGGAVVYTDSLLVARQISGEYRVKAPGLRPLHGQVSELACDLGVPVRWVPRAKTKAPDQLCRLEYQAHVHD